MHSGQEKVQQNINIIQKRGWNCTNGAMNFDCDLKLIESWVGRKNMPFVLTFFNLQKCSSTYKEHSILQTHYDKFPKS